MSKISIFRKKDQESVILFVDYVNFFAFKTSVLFHDHKNLVLLALKVRKVGTNFVI